MELASKLSIQATLNQNLISFGDWFGKRLFSKGGGKGELKNLNNYVFLPRQARF